MKKENIYNLSEKIAFIFLCIVMADCCIFGAGKLVAVGSIGFRMIMLAGMLVFAIPSMLKHFKEIIRDKYVIAILAFALWLCVALVIGIVNENKTALIASDVKGFMYFIALPAMLVLVNSKDRIHTIMKIMMYASLVMSIFVVIMVCAFIWIQPEFMIFNKFLTEKMISSFSLITPTMPRMFFKSVVYMLCGCAFSVYFQVKAEKKKLKLHYVFITAICLFSMFMTFTRSVYLGAFFAAAGTAISLFVSGDKNERKALVVHIGGAVAVFLAVVMLFSTISKTNYLEFAILRSTVTEETITNKPNVPDDGEADINDIYEDSYLKETYKSDQKRELTLQGLYRNIKKSPIVGIGLGASFEERAAGLNEYFYLDLWSKAGIIGVLLYMCPVALLAHALLKGRKHLSKDSHGVIILFSILIGYMAISWFNPYMNASLGILFYCFTIASTKCWEKEE